MKLCKCDPLLQIEITTFSDLGKNKRSYYCSCCRVSYSVPEKKESHPCKCGRRAAD